ncbi:hypothetical protein GCM10022381_24670 [Leifsonia kafniensis]|uniref:SipL SPOCS domain-containing protein n=1 Tax=Leifsonia kafniensis TaxID=475957 RepID=A0ABP7KLP3_9MICO
MRTQKVADAPAARLPVCDAAVVHVLASTPGFDAVHDANVVGQEITVIVEARSFADTPASARENGAGIVPPFVTVTVEVVDCVAVPVELKSLFSEGATACDTARAPVVTDAVVLTDGVVHDALAALVPARVRKTTVATETLNLVKRMRGLVFNVCVIV